MLRRVAPALLLLLLGMPGLASAQYFGRNKVQYTNFKFKIIQTEHFDVYYYPSEKVASRSLNRQVTLSSWTCQCFGSAGPFPPCKTLT